MSLHRIHLRGPWKLEWNSGDASGAQKIRLPADWNDLFFERRGWVRLTRRFHRPTNLEPKDEVDLVFEQWPGAWSISLNRCPVGQFEDPSGQSGARISITPLLEQTNLLSAETTIERPACDSARHGLVGNLVLEIRGD